MRAIASPTHSWPRLDARLHYLAASLAIIVAYIAAGELARQLHELAGPMGTIWVPSGLGLAIILFDGPRLWPAIAIGTFFGVVMRQHPAEALIVTTTEVLEALAAYYFLRRMQFRAQLDRVRDVAAFAAIELATLFAGATLGTAAFAGLGLTHDGDTFRLWTTWWWIGVSSDLILTPALLTWAAKSSMPRIDRRRYFPEAALLALCGVVLLVLILTDLPPSWMPPTRPYLLMPALLWAGLRFGPRGAATATLVVSATALVADAVGLGPFTRPTDLQSFVVISSVTTLMLSALAQERLRAVARKVAIQLAALDAIITVDTEGHVLELNPAAERLFGLRESDVIGKDLAELVVPPRLRDAYRRELRAYVSGRRNRVAGTRYRTTAWRAVDGREFPIEIAVTTVPVEDQVVLTGFIRDVTTEHEAELVRIQAKAELQHNVAERTAQLEDALREKDVLLREVHHRVKNNLQVISSLLNLQLASEPGESTRRGLRESQNRILSMALVHQLLYRSKDFARIDVGDYLRNLVDQIVKAYDASPGRIATSVIAPAVQLDLDRAIPCGLIVNELVANALEHAFPEPRTGTIRIALEQRGPLLVLTVADNGIGMKEAFSETTSTFGLRIVKTLALQLDGDVEALPTAGTVIRVTFPAAHPDAA